VSADDGGDAYWARCAELGALSGHVVCRCPECLMRCLVSYRPPSQPWPRCRVCLMPTVEIPVRWGEPRRLTRAPAPRVVPVDHPSLVVHKRPGQPRTARQLARDGLVRIPSRGLQTPPGASESPDRGVRRPSEPLEAPGPL
jgi:hypothetical protein